MKFIAVRVGLIIFVTLAVSGGVKGQDYWSPVEPFRIAIDKQNPELRELLERWDRIGLEAQGLMYQKSGYRGWLLRWAPNAGFVYVFHSEGISIIDFSYGKVEVTSSGIRFIPERDMRENFRGNRLKTPLTWVPAKSPHAKYMIPTDEIKNFGQYVAGLRNYNDFNGPCCEFDPFFVSSVSPGEIRTGVQVAGEFQRFISQPVTGRIVSVGKRRIVRSYGLKGELYSHYFEESSLTPFVIDAGRMQGLRKNMMLRLVGDQFNLPGQFIRVTSVGQQTATAVLIRSIDERNNESYIINLSGPDQRRSFPPIRAGMRVTSSPILNN